MPVFQPVLEGPPPIPQPQWIVASPHNHTSMSRTDLQQENDELRENLQLAQTHHKAQNMIIEGSHAQLAQVLSSDEFLEKMRHQADRWEAEAAQKTKNAETRASRKEAVARVEEEWMKIKEAHTANVHAWEADCKKLASEGIPKKEWPKKPTQPCKPQVPILDQVPEEADDKQDNINDEELD
ncbi:hypothetical protein DXG01_003962 [Tephrocybe rancida]|nr:hypothetical protein DXG01_003962 [Tephrocybe rancida]